MKRCHKCRRQIPDGGLAYEVRIEVRADFDGTLPAARDAEDLDAHREELLQAMASRDEASLMAEVHHVETHLLCPRCRERFLANPLNMPLPEPR
ncbi:MAG TPA: hypothetical protein VMG58_07245 [Candidatus Sulfotelmatobacter sp.]|nr:hypothetical protein [Candidatus Sulfotelmatobacter sp.]